MTPDHHSNICIVIYSFIYIERDIVMCVCIHINDINGWIFALETNSFECENF